MKFLTHPVVVAFGFVMLVMLPVIVPFIDPSHSTVYHLDGSPAPIFLSLLLLIGIVWLFAAGLLILARKPSRIRVAIWSALICMLPWIAAKVWALLLDWPIPHRVSLLLFLSGILIFIALNFFWRPGFTRFFELAQNFAATLLGFAAITNLIVVGQLCWVAWQTRDLNLVPPLHRHISADSHANAAGSGTHPRIVWLILDELSYRQIYERRFPGLALPAFDQLATQSILFTHVHPAGLLTEYVIPSLLSALPADEMRASWNGRDLSLLHPTQEIWQPFNPHQTIFQDAIDRGYSTGVSGWYNPYCRLLFPVLDRCSWTYHYAADGLSTRKSILANLVAPFHTLWGLAQTFFIWRTRSPHPDPADVLPHIQDYRQLIADTQTLLNQPSVDFVFLHMPVPHPSGIYDRHAGRLTTGLATYIDNLALADAYVARMRAQLQQQGEWDSSTILIMGDHSWRTTQMWIGSSAWTPEEQAASNGGQFDDRPAYILKLPYQHQPATIDTPFPAIQTRALLDAIMDQRIKSPQDVADWVGKLPATQP